jgi:LPXTG-motif cell wall-anchored protein
VHRPWPRFVAWGLVGATTFLALAAPAYLLPLAAVLTILLAYADHRRGSHAPQWGQLTGIGVVLLTVAYLNSGEEDETTYTLIGSALVIIGTGAFLLTRRRKPGPPSPL